MKLIAADTLAPVPWRNGGGQTRELFTDAPGSAWRVRISLADIAQNGPFSAFPGVQRHFAVLDGEGVVLTLDGMERPVTRGSGPVAFDGAQAPACRLIDGPTRDLNLMLQSGASGGLVAAVAGQPWDSPAAWRAAFVTGAALLHLTQGPALAVPAWSLAIGLPAGPLRWQPGPQAAGEAPARCWWVAVSGL